MPDSMLEDRAIGCLLGLAIGDALGTTLEFKRPGSFAPIDDLLGGGPFGLKPGQWTDDTSMALCLADSLIECGRFDPADQMRRYVRWWREGHNSVTGQCFDIGNTIAEALARFERSGDPYSGSTHEHSAGNGSLMRLAPVAIAACHDLETAIQWAGESSRTTHAAAACISACQYFAALLWGALNGASRHELLAGLYQPERWKRYPLDPEIRKIAEGSFRQKQPPEIRGSGYVVHTLEAALWACWHHDDFRTGALAVVNLGEDADTTGAVYGQIAGALAGTRGLPADWSARIDWRQRLIEHARSLTGIPGRDVTGTGRAHDGTK